MDELSEEELNTALNNGASKNGQQHHGFDVDDAFADSDDNDTSFEFSPAAIREEMARNMKHSWNADEDVEVSVPSIGYVDPDASVSTFDINGSPNDGPASLSSLQSPPPITRSLSQAGSFNDVQFSSEFSSISLSDPSPPDSSPQPEPEPETVHEDVEEPVSPYPAVQIDVSRPVAQVVTVTPTTADTASTADSVASSHDPSTVRSDGYEQSPRNSASAPSLSIPPSPLPVTPFSAPANNTPAASANRTRHRTAKSMGPSALDKVISKTRPKHLPPKDRKEDSKHMADWEVMMKQSRAIEEKRRKALQERRFQREKRVEASIALWEREILPDWTVVHRNSRLRKLWWQGVPTKLRATMWQNAVGNALALSKDAFKGYMARANRALAAGTFPPAILEYIEADIATSLPTLHLFAPGRGPLYQDLKDMLCAWTVARSDEGLGYVPGVSKIAAMLLMNMSPAQGFLVMRNLLERHCMRSFYGGHTSQADVAAYYRIFDTLLADGMPKIYFNFKQHQISPAAYLPEWLIPLFLDHLPFEACARLWDILLLEGDSFLYRAALGILAVLEPRLFFPDRQELLELLKGENKAAIEVAKRDGRILEGAAKYEIYGVDEEALWERIESMEEWWKESTWTRLIQRELPDL
ncbi:RabGAP/TBC [Cristinia sonorae]|uniref:RabGAP/TBC n=1 Tax=Cristinia sonorae TaxID=1940300 RepID=A0A8K0UL46_9AGAR|nr:RabGAP/TBC [Cristinia sonorae]